MGTVTSDFVLRNYPLVAKDLVSPLLEFLRIARQTCGDSDQALVLFAIAVRTYQHGDFRRIGAEAFAAGGAAVPPSLGTNARSVADSVGIPRETVRRRVQELMEAGLVLRNGHDLLLSARGLEHLAPARQALAGLAARYVQVLAGLADGAPDSAAERRAASPVRASL